MTSTSRRSSHETTTSTEMKKLPLKRLDVAFHKCAQVALPLHLNMLKNHRKNITKFQTLLELENIHREQVNASRVVQQLKADIWELERLRNQIRTEDVEEFDKKLLPLKTDTLNAIHEFLNEHKDVGNPVSLIKRASTTDNCRENGYASNILTDEEEKSNQEAELQQKQISRSNSLVSSWKSLSNELIGLNKLIHTFSTAVRDQQPQVDLIQDNLETTEVNVNQGTKQLTKAVTYKTAVYPLAGAAIGCCLGPVGLIIGMKVGAAVAVGGGVAGYFGGRYIKKRNETVAKSASVELSNLSKNKPPKSNSIDSQLSNDIVEK